MMPAFKLRRFCPRWLRVGVFCLGLIPFSSRAQLYAEADGGIGWTKWSALSPADALLPIELHPGESRARLGRWRAGLGWRLRSWLAADVSFGSGPPARATTTAGVSTILPVFPGEPDTNQLSLTKSDISRRCDTLEFAPLFLIPLHRGVTLRARAALSQITDTYNVHSRHYLGFVFQGPDVPLKSTSNAFERFRTWRVSPEVGVEWQLPTFPRFTLGVDAAKSSSPRERITSILGHASIAF